MTQNEAICSVKAVSEMIDRVLCCSGDVYVWYQPMRREGFFKVCVKAMHDGKEVIRSYGSVIGIENHVAFDLGALSRTNVGVRPEGWEWA